MGTDCIEFHTPAFDEHFRLPLPFAYESTGIVTQFTNGLIPELRSREVFSFHRPDELRHLVNLGDDQLRANLRNMPEFNTTGLWKVQAEATEKLEQSLADNRPRSLIQIDMGSGKTYMACSFSYRLIKFAKAKWSITFPSRTVTRSTTIRSQKGPRK